MLTQRVHEVCHDHEFGYLYTIAYALPTKPTEYQDMLTVQLTFYKNLRLINYCSLCGSNHSNINVPIVYYDFRCIFLGMSFIK